MHIDQGDERISFKLLNKNQDLKNNEEIDIEVIAKDDGEQKTERTKVKLASLKTVSQHLQTLRTNIAIQRNHELYANHGQSYTNSDLRTKLFQIIKDVNSNSEALKQRTIESFELNTIDTDV